MESSPENKSGLIGVSPFFGLPDIFMMIPLKNNHPGANNKIWFGSHLICMFMLRPIRVGVLNNVRPSSMYPKTPTGRR